MAGGGGFSSKAINFVVNNSVMLYCGVGISLYGVRKLQTQMAYNYWFGKHIFMRRIAKGAI